MKTPGTGLLSIYLQPPTKNMPACATTIGQATKGGFFTKSDFLRHTETVKRNFHNGVGIALRVGYGFPIGDNLGREMRLVVGL